MPTYNTTTKHALRWMPGTNVGLDIDAGFQALAEDIDAVMAVADQGTSLPTSSPGSPGKAGRFFRLTTTGQLFYDYGTGWADLLTRPTVVTALPTTNLYDGQIVHFQTAAMAATGTFWVLRYRPASASAFKSECIGGRPLVHFVGDQPSASANTYTTLPTGPDITPPLNGDYDWDIFVNAIYDSVISGSPGTVRPQLVMRAINSPFQAYFGLIVDSIGPSVGNNIAMSAVGRTELLGNELYRMQVLINLSGGGGAVNVGFFNRTARAMPVRVG
jgi:hypothetical protein